MRPLRTRLLQRSQSADVAFGEIVCVSSPRERVRRLNDENDDLPQATAVGNPKSSFVVGHPSVRMDDLLSVLATPYGRG